MSREWKPGDVAMVTWKALGVTRTERMVRAACRRRSLSTDVWELTDGTWIGDATAKDARPLVVIDPEDRAAVDRFLEIAVRWSDQVPYSDMAGPGDMDHTDAMQAALREFADPKPPKPDEPTGLGAVVEDAEGRLWVRFKSHELKPWWVNSGANTNVLRGFYRDIPAVRVLSQGVTP